MLYLLVFLILPFRAVFDKVIEGPSLRGNLGCQGQVRLERGIKLIRVLLHGLFCDLRGSLCLLDLAAADDLLVPLVDRDVAAVLFGCELVRFLVDLRLLSHFF